MSRALTETRRDDDERRHDLSTFVADNSMSIALFGLFALCLVGQGATGLFAYNASLRDARLPQLAPAAYLTTGQFLDGMFSNWQAAVLQLAVLVAFGSVLRQKGAAHSRKPDTANRRSLKWKFGPQKTLGTWLYANSLSLAFLALFATTFTLHAVFGSWKYNEDQALRHLPGTSLGAYTVSSDFWFSVFSCWEAEFVAIGLYMVLSIVLRQEGSSESKPVEATDEQTGGVNE